MIESIKHMNRILALLHSGHVASSTSLDLCEFPHLWYLVRKYSKINKEFVNSIISLTGLLWKSHETMWKGLRGAQNSTDFLYYWKTHNKIQKGKKGKPIQRIELYLHLENAFVYIMCSNSSVMSGRPTMGWWAVEPETGGPAASYCGSVMWRRPVHWV